MNLAELVEFLERVGLTGMRLIIFALIYFGILNLCTLIWQYKVYAKIRDIDVDAESEDTTRKLFVANLFTLGCMIPLLFTSWMYARTVDRNMGTKFDGKLLCNHPAWQVVKVMLAIPVILIIVFVIRNVYAV